MKPVVVEDSWEDSLIKHSLYLTNKYILKY